ncbi:MAG TPA: DUF1016 N-terminal domain-containing protein [Candidatus Bathyarchaeia archaeon]|nr:DUF1016 N-terminal domain-containing protein [Candidatus Bathyarchaeia archaeon]
MPKLPATERFRKLVDDISNLYLTARASQVKFAWETGKRIVEEEQNGQMRAQYGTRLIPELSKELSKMHGPGFSTRNLANMRRFYQSHRILQAPAKLNWTDYVELLPVKDEKIRKRLEQRVAKEHLNSRQLRRVVREVRRGREPQKGSSTTVPALPEKTLAPLKRPGDLKLNTFSTIVDDSVDLEQDEVLVDCGFFVNWPVKKDALKQVTVTDKPSFTYAATIDRVVDGDTLRVVIKAGFRIIVREKLRLRGINTSELGTPEGDAAKKYVSKLLPKGSVIVLKSHKCKTDTYGRFVVDVFYKQGAKSAEEILKAPVYLNQQLLDEGIATRMEE